jgi:hypothetical protein
MQPGVLGFQFFQGLDLVSLQPAVFRAPAVVRHVCDANRADRLGHGPALCRQDINLPRFGDDLLGRVSLHALVLHLAQCHTSGRTTFVWADQI